jgi:hypothetical protein
MEWQGLIRSIPTLCALDSRGISRIRRLILEWPERRWAKGDVFLVKRRLPPEEDWCGSFFVDPGDRNG